MPEPLDRAAVAHAPGQWTGVASGYALSFAALVAAVLLRYGLDPWMGDTLQLVTLFGAVAAAVWAGGYRPAILVTVLGYLVCHYLFIPPRGRLDFDSSTVIGLLAYLFTCALIIGLGDAMRRAQLRASRRRELLEVTLHSIGDAVITTDVGRRITYMNEVAAAVTRWTRAEATGQLLDAVFRIVNEDTRQPAESPAARALREGVVVGLANHTILIQKDGGECSIDDSAAPIRDERGHISGCVLIFRDITDRRRLEREKAGRLHTAQLLASIIESSDDAIISKSLDGIIRSWNAAAERLFGHPAQHAIGRHVSLIIPPERLSEEEQIIGRLKAGQRIEHFETERLRADGQRLQVSLTISPMRDDAGTVVGASKIVRDISERKRAEAERQKFVTLVESSTDFVGMCDLDGMPFFVNRAGLEMVGLDLEEALRTPVASFFFPEDRPRILDEFFPRVLREGHGEVDVRFRHFKTGQARWMAYKVLTVSDESGRPVAFATVSQDVTERRRLEDSLRQLAADLSDADRRKNEFLAMLAHELRNPLAPISNAARALRLGGGDPDSLRSASEMLERQVRQMARLVDDLLDMSRITRGRIELRKERVELASIVEQAVEAVREQYRSMGHELLVSLPPEPVHLHADPARMAQVIANLLNNACKFTDRGGRVSLTVELDGDQATIRVRDNGIGIPAEHLGHVFEMFAQVDTSLERSRDGLGIGLTLVRTLAEMHGGSVAVHSDGPGRGSEFTVRLPVMVGAPQAEAKPGAAETAPAVPRRVLIVDDNVDGADSLAMLLKFGGHETHQAHDGQQALAAAERLRPEVVLLDIGLPVLNGYEVCRQIRSQPWGRDIVLIALTGWGQEEDRHRSTEAGFDAHIVKPVDHDVLLKMLDSLPSARMQKSQATLR